RADILERPLRPTMRADPPLPAIFLRLRLNKVLLQFRQCPFPSASVSPTVAAEHSAVLLAPVLISCVRTVPSPAVNSTMTRRFIPFPRPAVFGPAHITPRFETASLSSSPPDRRRGIVTGS